jgi:hypothetical protein
MSKEKIYFNCHVDEGGVYFVSKKRSSINCTLRMAGNPKFILQEYIKRHGKEKGIEMYRELLDILYRCGGESFSPFVLYLYKDE